MAALSIEELRDTPPMRFVLPLVVLIIPGFVYALLTEWVFGAMTPVLPLDLSFLPGLDSTNATPSLAVLGADLQARYTFGLATSAFLICAIAALVIAILRLAQRWGFLPATVVLAGCLLGGAIFASMDGHPLRELVSERVLGKIDALGASHMTGAAGHIAGLVILSEALGVAAIVALVLRFADIAFEPSLEYTTENTLRRRTNAFRNTLMMGGLLLALSVASAHAFYHYPAALLEPETAAEFEVLAGTAATFFGAMYSGLLLLVAVPCYAAISTDAAVAAELKAGESHAARSEWLDREGLTIAPKEALTSFLAIAAPFLTGTALEVFKSVSF